MKSILEKASTIEIVGTIAAVLCALFAVLNYVAYKDATAKAEVLDAVLDSASIRADSLAAEKQAEIDRLVQDTVRLAAELRDRPPPSPPTPPRYFLRLLSLSCERTEDSTGADEAYLKVNGNRVWSENMNDGRLRRLDEEIEFAGSATITLYDADGSLWFDSDDYLGRVDANTSQANEGEKTGRFSRDGARYELKYEVVSR